MHQSQLTRQRSTALFFVGLFLLFSPILFLFDRGNLWLGIPVIYLWLFAIWAVLILVSALILEAATD